MPLFIKSFYNSGLGVSGEWGNKGNGGIGETMFVEANGIGRNSHNIQIWWIFVISRDIFTAENNLSCANRLHRIIKRKKNNIVQYELKEYKRRSSLVVWLVIFQTEDRSSIFITIVIHARCRRYYYTLLANHQIFRA